METDRMTAGNVEKLLSGQTTWAGQKIYHYPEIDSTNVQAKRLAETEGALHGTLVIADQQSAGRGRRGRGWESPAGSSISMSILLRPDFVPAKASMLTLVMAHSTARALQKCTGLDVQIKWPNDIVINGKKLVGILTEMNTGMDSIDHIVIGVGINVNIEAFPAELAEKATSLKIECGRYVERGPVISEIIKQFEQDYEMFLKNEDLSWMLEAYNGMLVNRGKEVRILEAEQSYQALALGINEKGELLVRREDGTEEAVYAGEVSVRGVYGYV